MAGTMMPRGGPDMELRVQELEQELTDVSTKLQETQEQITFLLDDHKDLREDIQNLTMHVRKAATQRTKSTRSAGASEGTFAFRGTRTGFGVRENEAVSAEEPPPQPVKVGRIGGGGGPGEAPYSRIRSITSIFSPLESSKGLRNYKGTGHGGGDGGLKKKGAGDGSQPRRSASFAGADAHGDPEAAGDGTGNGGAGASMHATLGSDESSLIMVMANDPPEAGNGPRVSEKRRFGKPQLRVLIPSEAVAKVVGPTGDTIGSLARSTGTTMTFSRRSWPGTHSRVLTVEQQKPEARPSAAVLEVLRTTGAVQQRSSKDDEVKLIILVPEHLTQTVLQNAKEAAKTMREKVKLSLMEPTTEPQTPYRPRTCEPEGGLVVHAPSDSLLEILEVATLPAQNAGDGPATAGVAALQATEGGRTQTDGYTVGRASSLLSDVHLDGYWAQLVAEQQAARRESQQQRFREEVRRVQLKFMEFGFTMKDYKWTEAGAIRLAKRRAAGTPKENLLALFTSGAFQVVSLSFIVLSVMLMWVEVDSGYDTYMHETAQRVQHLLSGLFLLEAMAIIYCIPYTKFYRVFWIDAIAIISVFVLETTLVLVDAQTDPVLVLLLVRLVRFMRVFRYFRNYRGFRTVRVLVAGFKETLLTLFWVCLLLFSICFSSAVVFKSIFKGVKYHAENEPELMDMVSMYFPSVGSSMLTLIEVFLDANEFSSHITEPLLQSETYHIMGYVWIAYLIAMRLCLANLVTGLLVEQIIRAGVKGEAAAERELLASQDVTFESILDVWKKIDKANAGFITLDNLYVALQAHPDIDSVLQHRGPQGEGDAESFFTSLDIGGSGEMSFSDFAYGVIKHRYGEHSLDHLLFDYQMATFIRQSAQTSKEASESNSLAQTAFSKLEAISRFLISQKGRQTSELQCVRNKLNSMQQRLQAMNIGLGVCGQTAGDGEQPQARGLLNIKNLREAKDIAKMLHTLRETMERATVAAQQQWWVSEQALTSFRKEVAAEVQKQVCKVERDSADAKQAAGAAARAAQAALVALQSQTPRGQHALPPIPASPLALLAASEQGRTFPGLAQPESEPASALGAGGGHSEP